VVMLCPASQGGRQTMELIFRMVPGNGTRAACRDRGSPKGFRRWTRRLDKEAEPCCVPLQTVFSGCEQAGSVFPAHYDLGDKHLGEAALGLGGGKGDAATGELLALDPRRKGRAGLCVAGTH